MASDLLSVQAASFVGEDGSDIIIVIESDSEEIEDVEEHGQRGNDQAAIDLNKPPTEAFMEGGDYDQPLFDLNIPPSPTVEEESEQGGVDVNTPTPTEAATANHPQRRLNNEGSMTASKESVSLREIKEGQCHDLVCKILHVSQVNQEEWMLFVWDGTDASPLEIQSELKTEKENPLPLQLEPQPLARDTFCRFPTVGSILRVSINQRNTKLNIPSLIADRWVKIFNLMCEVHGGLWCGVVTSSTKVRFVPSEDLIILEREKDFKKRFSSKWGRMPYTSYPWPDRITDFDDDVGKVPICTLMDILTHQQVTAKFKCIVRVVAAIPWKVEDFRSPKGIYRIRVTLEDPTGRIQAYLYDDDAEVFFEGYPPMGALIRKWNTLLGVAVVDGDGVIENAPRNPPWFQCCIKSYYLDKSDVWGSRRFRIFNTKLIC